jgi:DNA-binding CsgD family transcriptional regulator
VVALLPERDIRRFVDFAHETERVARVEPRRLYRWAIEGIGQLVACDGLSHIESNRGVGGRLEASLTRVSASNPRFEVFRNSRELVTAWNERLAYEHPVAVYRIRHLHDLRPLRLSDLTTVNGYRRLEVYDVLTRPFGFAWTMSAAYRGPRGLHEIVCARVRPDFTDREMTLLELATAVVGLAARDPAPTVPAGLPLTAREADVLERVARGRSNAEIAQALSIAPGTVKKHLDNIFGKLGTRNRVEAARAWHRACAD